MEGIFEIKMYDDIGLGGIDAKQVRESLSYISRKDDVKKVVFRVISYGGSVHEANGIINAINEFKARTGKKVTFINDCYAASSAVNIMVAAGDEVLGFDNSVLLVHRAWLVAAINSKTAEEAVKSLESATEPSIQAIIQKTGRTREEVEALMDEERWLTHSESLEFGLVDGTYDLSEIDIDQALAYMANSKADVTNEIKQYANELLTNRIGEIKQDRLVARAGNLVSEIKARWE